MIALLRRDLLCAYRRRGDLLNPPAFFLVVLSLFPLASQPDPERLAQLAPAVLWVAALLAGLLSLDRVFRDDLRDGSMEQMLLSGASLPLLSLAKVGAHWLVSGLPLVLIAWPAARMLHLDPAAIPTLIASLSLGTALLSLIGGFGAALTAGLRDGGLLLALIALPLMLPVLIFGARATDMAVAGLSAAGPLYLMAAGLLLGAALLPLAIAAALEINLE